MLSFLTRHSGKQPARLLDTRACLVLGKADMDAPASKPREDSPASGPSPEVQVPGKQAAPEPIPADDEQPETAA